MIDKNNNNKSKHYPDSHQLLVQTGDSTETALTKGASSFVYWRLEVVFVGLYSTDVPESTRKQYKQTLTGRHCNVVYLRKMRQSQLLVIGKPCTVETNEWVAIIATDWVSHGRGHVHSRMTASLGVSHSLFLFLCLDTHCASDTLSSASKAVAAVNCNMQQSDSSPYQWLASTLVSCLSLHSSSSSTTSPTALFLRVY